MEIFLSSSKRGYGLRELMNPVETEFWHSDDVLPHSISIVFSKKTFVYSIEMLLSYSLDESYTPEKIALYYNDCYKVISFSEPEGIKELPVGEFVFEINIVILNNHTDGKDSHVRLLRVLRGPGEFIKYDTEKFK